MEGVLGTLTNDVSNGGILDLTEECGSEDPEGTIWIFLPRAINLGVEVRKSTGDLYDN